MHGQVDAAGLLLADMLGVGLLWFSVMLAVVVVCRQPWWRRFLGRLAMVGSVAILPLVLFSPLERLDVAATWRQWATVGEREASARDVFRAGGGPRLVFRKAAEWRAATVVVGSSEGLVHAIVVMGGAALLCGVGFLAMGVAAARRLTGLSQSPGEETRRLYEGLVGDTDSQAPRLRVSDQIMQPVLLGVVRPVILIPASLEGGTSPDGLVMAIEHELAHWRQGDVWFTLLSALCWMIWPLIPPFWWVQRQLRIDQEYVADHVSLSRLGMTGSGYARTLLELAEKKAGVTSGAGEVEEVVERSGASSVLVDRTLLLVKSPFAVELRGSIWWRVGGLLAGSGVLLLLSSVSVRGFFCGYLG